MLLKVSAMACTVKDCGRKLNSDAFTLVLWNVTSSFGAPVAHNTLQLQDHFCIGIWEEQILSMGQLLNMFAHVPGHLPLLQVVLTTGTDTWTCLWSDWFLPKRCQDFKISTYLVYFSLWKQANKKASPPAIWVNAQYRKSLLQDKKHVLRML